MTQEMRDPRVVKIIRASERVLIDHVLDRVSERVQALQIAGYDEPDDGVHNHIDGECGFRAAVLAAVDAERQTP